MGQQPRILLTRPADRLTEIAAGFAAQGWAVLADPLLTPEPLSTPCPPGPFTGWLFTSATCLALRPDLPALAAAQGLPLHAVGPETAAALRRLGHAPQPIGTGGLEALLALLPHPGRLLHPGNADRGGLANPPALPAGLEILPWPIYRMRPAKSLSPETASALLSGSLTAVALFSARSARVFLDLVAAASLGPRLTRLEGWALSSAIADILQPAGFARIRVAERPDRAALLALTGGAGGVQ